MSYAVSNETKTGHLLVRAAANALERTAKMILSLLQWCPTSAGTCPKLLRFYVRLRQGGAHKEVCCLCSLQYFGSICTVPHSMNTVQLLYGIAVSFVFCAFVLLKCQI